MRLLQNWKDALASDPRIRQTKYYQAIIVAKSKAFQPMSAVTDNSAISSNDLRARLCPLAVEVNPQ